MVSVIVPIFNAEKCLHRCIYSILSQTYNQLEVILIDDGSTDNSGCICDEFSKKDSRVQVIHQNNKGLVYARFVGVNAANGEWGFFVDADDDVPINAINILLNQSKGYDIVSGRPRIIHQIHNKTSFFPTHIKESGVFSGEEFICSLLTGSRLVSIWRQIIKMDILKKAIQNIPSQINICEDLILNLKIGIEAKHVKGIDDHVYNYYFYSSNMSNTIKITVPYLDLIDNTMDNILKGNIQFKDSFIKYRLDIISKHISKKGITNTSLVKNTLQIDSFYKKKLRYRILLFLCKIHYTPLRSVIWNSYNFISSIVHKLKK